MIQLPIHPGDFVVLQATECPACDGKGSRWQPSPYAGEIGARGHNEECDRCEGKRYILTPVPLDIALAGGVNNVLAQQASEIEQLRRQLGYLKDELAELRSEARQT